MIAEVQKFFIFLKRNLSEFVFNSCIDEILSFIWVSLIPIVIKYFPVYSFQVVVDPRGAWMSRLLVKLMWSFEVVVKGDMSHEI